MTTDKGRHFAAGQGNTVLSRMGLGPELGLQFNHESHGSKHSKSSGGFLGDEYR